MLRVHVSHVRLRVQVRVGVWCACACAARVRVSVRAWACVSTVTRFRECCGTASDSIQIE